MADEAIVNGVESNVDYQKRDTDFGKDSKVSELNGKIEALEQENSRLIHEKEGSDKRIKDLTKEIEGLKTDGSVMKEKLEQFQKEIENSSEDKKALQVISARAVDLEIEVSRLQHDLVSSMTESDEATVEVRKLKDALEEVKQSNLNKEAKVKDLEKEKVSLLERIEREVAEMKKSKSESEIQIRDLEETKSKILEKDEKILQFQKDIEGLESKVVESSWTLQKLQKEKDGIVILKSSLEEALKQSREKLMETEAKANRFQNELAESEKSVRELKEVNFNFSAVDAEKGSKGLKLQWQTAVASSGTVAAAAAALLYLNYARRR